MINHAYVKFIKCSPSLHRVRRAMGSCGNWVISAKIQTNSESSLTAMTKNERLQTYVESSTQYVDAINNLADAVLSRKSLAASYFGHSSPGTKGYKLHLHQPTTHNTQVSTTTSPPQSPTCS
jgi:hypothetical protein